MMVSTALAVLLVSTVISSDATSCLTTQVDCMRDSECGPIQNDYLANCALASVPGGTCTQTCKEVYSRLLGNRIGRNVYQCDCGTDSLSEICISFRENFLRICYNGVSPTPPPAAPTCTSIASPAPAEQTCTTVQESCAFNPTCSVRFFFYLEACATAFTDLNCSQLCNESFYDLLHHPLGSKFYRCTCGNDSSCYLEALQERLVDSCYNGRFPVPPSPEENPSSYPPGTCESFYEQCFQDNYETCGSRFEMVIESCNASLTHWNCTMSGLRSLLSTVSHTTDILTCNCSNSSSRFCQRIMSLRTTFDFFGVSATILRGTPTATAAATTCPITPTASAMQPTEPPPIGCQRIKVKKPLVEKSSPRIKPKFKIVRIGTTFTYRCRKRLSLIGNVSRNCQPDGEYSAQLPRCAMPPTRPVTVQCLRQKVTTPLVEKSSPKVKAKAKTVSVGTTLTYKCKKRFNLNGSSARVCQQDGQYSAALPSCVMI